MLENDKWTTLKVLQWTKDYLGSKGVKNARLESEWMLCHVCEVDRVGLYLQYDKPLNEKELFTYRNMISRRARREPLQHILGSQEFYGFDFDVTADVLIPRQDTECIIEAVLQIDKIPETILDVGAGSGCLSVVLKKLFANSDVTATDISKEALRVARLNADKHGVNIEFLIGSLFTPLSDRKFDLIVSNPPYIPTADIMNLEIEVRDFDPMLALDGGGDGLEIYRKIIPEALNHLNPAGWLVLEVGVFQAEEVINIFNNSADYSGIKIKRDYGNIDRVLYAQKRDKNEE
ncbi:MAG: peptide chain release factor N(5)-glutamine methyltransferase [Desulfuromonadaceae bacterium]|nr:peptide chain release factor N(5)-glutamine methyltransferase [Desulfuromonadaceae bacterium]MDD2854188.1 peptide chain release factor N(5)-glutamine methyltransferase [Desulfuromonadaceae bacterium]